jgi:putative redox protein
MVEMNVVYRGQLRCTATHGPSASALETDAPADNHGKGERFSPTDLVATALGTCILTTTAIRTRDLGIDLEGATCTVVKEMVSTPVRRIGRLVTTVRVRTPTTPEQRRQIEHIAHHCPVYLSLHPDVQMPITFEWADDA